MKHIKVYLYFMISIFICILAECGDDVRVSYAKESKGIEYQYDRLGRISAVVYADGSKVEYEYDRNGNLLSVHLRVLTDKDEGGEKEETTKQDEDLTDTTESKTTESRTTENKATESKTTESRTTENKTTENKVTESRTTENRTTETKTEATRNNFDAGEHSNEDTGKEDISRNITMIKTEEPNNMVDVAEDAVMSDNGSVELGNNTETMDFSSENNAGSISGYKASELENYSSFRRKRPSIQMLEQTRRSRHLKIKIKQAVKRSAGGEIGYQIRYAANSKFKNSKTFAIKRKGKYTSYTYKRKRLAINKTYYVKVRAYVKNKAGKKIYSKYSKVKKITIVK